MSSEQRYDYSYEQFVQDDLPSLDLFGDSVMTSLSDAFSDSVQHDHPPHSQKDEQSFYDDTYLPEQSPQFNMMDDVGSNFEFNAATTQWPSALSTFTPLNIAAISKGAGLLALGAESLHDEGGELHAVENDIFQPQMSEFEAAVAAQPSLRQIRGIPLTDEAKPNSDLAPEAHLESLQAEPINVSFFLEQR